MSQAKFGFSFLIAAALFAGTALVAGCSSPEKVTKTTTTEQSTSVAPMAPTTTSTTTTTSTQQSRP